MFTPPVKTIIFFLVAISLTACRQGKKIYTSDCNAGHSFKRVTLANIKDSLDFYNNKYVEVSGKYLQEKDLSILVGDKAGIVLQVEFSNECPLFLTGTRIGFFDYDNNNGQLTPANNKIVILRGEVVYHPKQKANMPKVSISRISYVQL